MDAFAAALRQKRKAEEKLVLLDAARDRRDDLARVKDDSLQDEVAWEIARDEVSYIERAI